MTTARLSEAEHFELPALDPMSGDAAGAAVTRAVPPGLYRLTSSREVRFADGKRTSLTAADLVLSPLLANEPFEVTSGFVTLAAATANDTVAWLVPLSRDEGAPADRSAPLAGRRAGESEIAWQKAVQDAQAGGRRCRRG